MLLIAYRDDNVWNTHIYYSKGEEMQIKVENRSFTKYNVIFIDHF